MYNSGSYRLLFVVKHAHTDDQGVTWHGCSACDYYEENYGSELIEAVRAYKGVSMSQIVYTGSERGAVLASPEEGGPKYVHPQLRSYILGFPSFVLVNEKNYNDPREQLDVKVFGRMVKSEKFYLSYENGNSPMVIFEWVKEQILELNSLSSRRRGQLVQDYELYDNQRKKFVPGLTDKY